MNAKALILISFILLSSTGVVSAAVWDLRDAVCGGPYSVASSPHVTWDVYQPPPPGDPNPDPPYINIEYVRSTGSQLRLVSNTFDNVTGGPESDDSHFVESAEAGTTSTVYIFYADNTGADHTQGYKTYPGGTLGTYISCTYDVTGVAPEFAFGLAIVFGMIGIIYFSMRRKFFGNQRL